DAAGGLRGGRADPAGVGGLRAARARDHARRAGVHAVRAGAGGGPRSEATGPVGMRAEPSSPPPPLSARALPVTYHTRAGATPAVRGVDFDLAVGETLGLAGESGCGKSSLAGALLRLLPGGTQVTGSVLLEGDDVLTMRPGRLRAVRWTEMAIVFQGALHTLNPVQRVGKQIGEAIELHSQGRAKVSSRVGELLELVGLPARPGRDDPH